MDLGGRTALVTGGARRIGRAICLALAKEGVRVAIHCRSSEAEARDLAERCPGSVVLRADLADAAERARLVPAAVDRLGGLDFLVNNASIYEKAPLAEIDEPLWEHALAVNLTAPFFLARDAGLHMRAKGSGAIVNVTDWATDRPYPDRLPYFAAKAGLEAATRGLARALAPEVRVNAVAPGPILLPEGAPGDLARAVLRVTPLGRLGGPEAVAKAVLFLLVHDFVTGETVRVDGGRSLK
ncbi:MAG TPA: SDR family oxidoreductase [Planctomycetota bacterium]|nr:SDR family oxidoreductase [Planctomycetota bacterium]